MTRIAHLKYFCKIVEFESFSKAADAIGITQPALSQQIKTLEDAYQTELLHRKGNHISLTDDGRIIYDYALKIIALYDRSLADVCPTADKARGRLLIGASSGPGEFPVPVLAGMYKQLHPEISISLKVGDTNEIIDLVLNQSLEIGFVGSQRRDSHLTFKPFFEDEMVLVLNPDHPYVKKKIITIEEFLSLPIILQQHGAGVRETFLEALGTQGIGLKDLNVFMELGLQDSAKAAAIAGFGGTVISKLGGINELETGKLAEVKVDDLNFSRPQQLCFNHMLPLSNLALDFLDFAEKHKGKLIKEYLSHLY